MSVLLYSCKACSCRKPCDKDTGIIRVWRLRRLMLVWTERVSHTRAKGVRVRVGGLKGSEFQGRARGAPPVLRARLRALPGAAPPRVDPRRSLEERAPRNGLMTRVVALASRFRDNSRTTVWTQITKRWSHNNNTKRGGRAAEGRKGRTRQLPL